MRNLFFIICFIVLTETEYVSAQRPLPRDVAEGQSTCAVAKEATREYSVIVYERPSDAPLSFEREISNGRLGGFWGGVFDVYRSTFAGKVVGYSSDLLDMGISLLTKAITQKKENHKNWETITRKEMTFTKNLPMQTEIADFYRDVSYIGAMDPEGLMFNGLGCRQYLTYKDDEGRTKKVLVFDIACSIDNSASGKQRILHHGKFEIKIDSILFNPYLCDLPNDSLNARQVEDALRIPFDFKRRKNLSVRLDATVTSSWFNEAVEMFKDQNLGQFQIEFSIPDSTTLDSVGRWKGYYTYKPERDYDNPKKNVRVTGESFIVPRSFIGTYKEGTEPEASIVSVWGTGQYRIDMRISESCQMNEKYYETGEEWKEEWKILKKRQHKPSAIHTLVDQFKTEFDMDNNKWVHTILDPIKTAVIVDETKWANKVFVGDKTPVKQK